MIRVGTTRTVYAVRRTVQCKVGGIRLTKIELCRQAFAQELT